jgi:hypothetical protein
VRFSSAFSSFSTLSLSSFFIFHFSFLTSPAPLATRAFESQRPAAVVAAITVRCDRCAWDVDGSEAVMLTLSLDGRYVQHLPTLRTGRARYRVALGAVAPGSHTVVVEEDPELTARALRGARAAAVEAIDVEQIAESDPRYGAVSFAPILHARPDTIGRFTDVPAFMWYEEEKTSRGVRYRYSVVFTNEDGGTPADRLMATWGRTTDIEYLYGVEVDETGAVLADEFQGPKHEIRPFRGRREDRRPLLWMATDNNMALDEGSARVRYAPAPAPFRLENVSREEVMDANPWLYTVMAQELSREGKIAPDAPPGRGLVADPRRFVYVEACGDLDGAAVSFDVKAGDAWAASDRGLPEFRIARSGCVRAAIPLPAGAAASEVSALRVQAFERPPGDQPPRASPGVARLTRVNKLFTLDDRFQPGSSMARWRGDRSLAPGGPPLELPVR